MSAQLGRALRHRAVSWASPTICAILSARVDLLMGMHRGRRRAWCSSRCRRGSTQVLLSRHPTWTSSTPRPSSAPPAAERLHFIEQRYAGDPTNWWRPNSACTQANAALRRLPAVLAAGDGGLPLRRTAARPGAGSRSTRRAGRTGPDHLEREEGTRIPLKSKSAISGTSRTNKSQLGPWRLDPDFRLFAADREIAGAQSHPRREPAAIPRLGGMSPIDAQLRAQHEARGGGSTCRGHRRARLPASTGTTGRFHHDWPQKLDEDPRADAPCRRSWVSEVGSLHTSAEEVQAWGVGRTAGAASRAGPPRISGTLALRLPARPGGDHAPSASGGLLLLPAFNKSRPEYPRGRGAPSPRSRVFRAAHARSVGTVPVSSTRRNHTVSTTPSPGCAGFGVRHLRTDGLSWADVLTGPNAQAWFENG